MGKKGWRQAGPAARQAGHDAAATLSIGPPTGMKLHGPLSACLRMCWPSTTALSIRRLRHLEISGKWEISSTNRRARYYRLTAARRKRLTIEHSKWEQMAATITRVKRPV